MLSSFSLGCWKKMKPLFQTVNPTLMKLAISTSSRRRRKLISDSSIADTLNDFFVNPRIHKKEEDFDNHPSIITTKGKSYRVDFAFMEITTENVTGCLLKINAAKYTDPDGSTPNI